MTASISPGSPSASPRRSPITRTRGRCSSRSATPRFAPPEALFPVVPLDRSSQIAGPRPASSAFGGECMLADGGLGPRARCADSHKSRHTSRGLATRGVGVPLAVRKGFETPGWLSSMSHRQPRRRPPPWTGTPASPRSCSTPLRARAPIPPSLPSSSLDWFVHAMPDIVPVRCARVTRLKHKVCSRETGETCRGDRRARRGVRVGESSSRHSISATTTAAHLRSSVPKASL